jgi:hypothetical protein
MSTPLQSALSSISEEFAQKVFELIRSSFIAELGNVTLSPGAAPALRARKTAPKAAPKAAAPKAKSEPAKKGGAKEVRLARRSPESIAKALDSIVGLLQKKGGIGSEEIQKTLGLARNEIARPIALGISTGALRKVGEKRATKYYAGGARASSKKAEAVKKGAKKAPKKASKKGAEAATEAAAEST